MTMLRLSRADAVLADGKLCAISRIDRDIIELQPLGEPEAVQALSHLELLALLTKGSFSVEYGYFSSRQAARRAIAGRGLLSMLSDSEQQLVFWKIAWCEAFLAAESDGEVTRSEHSCTGFIPELERRIIATARQSSGKGRLPETTMLPAPCRTSLMTWVRLWEKTRDPMALVKRSRFNGANAPKISRERESAVQGKLSEYLHPNQILIPELHRSINADIRKQNALFGPADIKPLAEVSESTVRRRVACLDQFEVCAAREGAAKAKSKYGPHGGGIQIDVPLQRIEMDEWEIDLMAILAGAGVDVTQSSLRDLAVGRYWICVAVDAATRSILAVKLSASPSVAGALATVWMAMRDKTDMARHLGCETAWPQHGHLNHVVVDNGPALVDSEFKAALSDLNIGYTETRKLTLTLDHDFNDRWSNRTQFRYGKNEVEQITQITLSAAPDMGPTTWGLYNSYVPGEQTEYSLNTSFQGQIEAGAWEHTLLFGADWSRIEDYSLMYMDYAGSNDLLNPGPWPEWTMPSTLAMGEGNGRYTTAGAFVQVQSSVGRLHLLGGLRLAYLKTDYDSEGYGRRDTLDDTRVLPRLGAVYDVTDQLSAFASYSEGMSANAFYFYSAMPKPEYSKQAEIGVKYDNGTLAGSIAAFRIERKNVPVTDPNDPTYLTSITEGQQRSKGVELDGVWQPGGAWRVMANYAYTDAELTADIPNGAPAGSDLPGVPRHSGSIWIDYDQRDEAGDGWRAGVGVHAASSSWINQSNSYKTAGYGVVNVSGSYTDGGMTYSVAIKNLLDRNYDLPFWKMMEGRVSPGAERQILLNVSHSF